MVNFRGNFAGAHPPSPTTTTTSEAQSAGSQNVTSHAYANQLKARSGSSSPLAPIWSVQWHAIDFIQKIQLDDHSCDSNDDDEVCGFQIDVVPKIDSRKRTVVRHNSNIMCSSPGRRQLISYLLSLIARFLMRRPASFRSVRVSINSIQRVLAILHFHVIPHAAPAPHRLPPPTTTSAGIRISVALRIESNRNQFIRLFINEPSTNRQSGKDDEDDDDDENRRNEKKHFFFPFFASIHFFSF